MPLPVCTHTPAACNACTPRCAVCAPTAPCRPTMPRVPPCTYAPVGSQCDVRVLITRARLLHVVGRAQHRTVLAPVLRVLDRLHATTLGRVGGPDVVPTPHEQWFSTVRTGRPVDRRVLAIDAEPGVCTAGRSRLVGRSHPPWQRCARRLPAVPWTRGSRSEPSPWTWPRSSASARTSPWYVAYTPHAIRQRMDARASCAGSHTLDGCVRGLPWGGLLMLRNR